MTRHLVALMLVACSSLATAQTATWAHNLAFPNQHYISAITTTSLGESITTINNRKGTMSTTGLYLGDLIIQKKDSLGQLIWQKSFTATAVVLALKSDSLGNIILAGAYRGTLTLGSFTFNAASLANSLFIAKLDPMGNVLWAQADQTSTNSNNACNLAIGNNNDIYITAMNGIVGSFSKYTSAGSLAWTKTVTGVRTFSSIAVHKNNDIYVTGTCFPSAVFDTVTTPLPSASYITFLAKYNPQQQAQWVRAAPYITFDARDALLLNNNTVLWFHQRNQGGSTPVKFALHKYDMQGSLLTETTSFTNSTALQSKIMANRMVVSPNNDIFISFAAFDTMRLSVLDSNLANKLEVRWISKSVNAPFLTTFSNKLLMAGNYSGATLAVNPYTLANTNSAPAENDNFIAAMALESFTNTTLPVSLQSFTARVEYKHVKLNWTTAAETLNSGFEVQRRNSGSNNWTVLGFVEANATAEGIGQYSFVDESPIAGTNYYRLRQVDRDGNFRYSRGIQLNFQPSIAELSIYPNPVLSKGIIRLSLAKPSTVSIAIFNASAMLVKQLPTTALQSGSHSFEMNLSHLPPGVYRVQVLTGNEFFNQMIVKAGN